MHTEDEHQYQETEKRQYQETEKRTDTEGTVGVRAMKDRVVGNKGNRNITRLEFNKNINNLTNKK